MWEAGCPHSLNVVGLMNSGNYFSNSLIHSAWNYLHKRRRSSIVEMVLLSFGFDSLCQRLFSLAGKGYLFGNRRMIALFGWRSCVSCCLLASQVGFALVASLLAIWYSYWALFLCPPLLLLASQLGSSELPNPMVNPVFVHSSFICSSQLFLTIFRWWMKQKSN